MHLEIVRAMLEVEEARLAFAETRRDTEFNRNARTEHSVRIKALRWAVTALKGE